MSFLFYCRKNIIFLIFSFFFNFFFISSFIFNGTRGFENTFTLFITIFITLLLTFPTTCILNYLINHYSYPQSLRPTSYQKLHPTIKYLFEHTYFYGSIIFLLHLPIYLAFYPGIIYYDINTQIEQYESRQFITNHPLIHTYIMGLFKNLFDTPNTGYAIIILIQMIFVSFSMGYGLKTLFQYSHNLTGCIIISLFYGLCPTYPLLSISSTKDIFFSATLFILIIDMINYFKLFSHSTYFYIRFILNAVLMLLLRNNAVYAFVAILILILLKKSKNNNFIKYTKILFVTIFISYLIINKILTFTLNADSGSIKEMMSIPAQEMGRIYSVTNNSADKKLIRTYIEEPELYNYYLADSMKQQLPFEIIESKSKHFLLDSFILNFRYPVTCMDAILYNTQGYWDIFHSPYQSDHFFLATSDYRGNAILLSKFPLLSETYIKLFHTTQNIQNNLLLIPFLNSGIYIWVFLFCLTIFLYRKDYTMFFINLYPLFYLSTLCLGPGAIIRYSFPFLLLSPILLPITLYLLKNNSKKTKV